MTGMVLAACPAVLLHASAPRAFCSCAGPRTDAEAAARAEVVFTGRPVCVRREAGAPAEPPPSSRR